MHQSILARRHAAAIQRIVNTASALVEQHHLDPRLIDGLQPRGIKDPAAAEMMRLEGLADLLDQIPVTVETPPELPPVNEPPPPSAPALVIETLPAPVVEDDEPAPSPRKPGRKKKQ